MAEKMKDGIRKRFDRPKPFSVGWRDPETKNLRWKSFRTEEEAKAHRDKVRVDIREGTYIAPKRIAFRAFAEDWLARTQPTVSPNTHALHEWAVRKYLIGTLHEDTQAREPAQALGDIVFAFDLNTSAAHHPPLGGCQVTRQGVVRR